LVLQVREQADGTVLVADPLGKVLLDIDMDRGVADTVGSEGPGPDEYGQPDAVWALRDGRALLVDLGNARLTEIAEDGSFGQTHPLSSGTPGPPGSGSAFEIRIPDGVDAEGRVYYQGRAMSFETDDLPTHAPVRRWDPADGSVADIAEVLLPSSVVSRSGGANDQSVQVRPVPLSPEDAFAVTAEGRVAIVRADPYRVDWLEVDGSVSEGPEVPIEAVPVSRAEQEAWLEGRARNGGGVGVSVEIENNDVRTTFARGAGSDRVSRQDIAQYTWPEHLPPFVAEDVRVAADNTVWVRRSQAAGLPPLYDRFDREGRLVGQVEFDQGRRVIGFGSESAYVVRYDEFDVPTLERYALP